MVSTSAVTDVVAVSPTAVLSATERVLAVFSASGLAGESSVQAAVKNMVNSRNRVEQSDLPPPYNIS